MVAILTVVVLVAAILLTRGRGVGGLLLGIGLYAALVRGRIGGIPLRFETTAVLVWTALLVAGGLLSSLFSARRVMALDPYAATTGAGVGS